MLNRRYTLLSFTTYLFVLAILEPACTGGRTPDFPPGVTRAGLPSQLPVATSRRNFPSQLPGGTRQKFVTRLQSDLYCWLNNERSRGMGDLSRNFDRSEFACTGYKCCGGSAPVTSELVNALQQLRDLANVPLYVTSGFRCKIHNARTIGAAPNSFHTLGMAADIQSPEMSPQQLAKFAELIPAFNEGGIKIYPSWLHVDVRTNGRWRG